MKNIFPFLIVLTMMIFASCDDVDDVVNPGDDCQLEKTIWSITNDPAMVTTDYIYNNSDQLVEVRRVENDLNSDDYVTRWVIEYVGNDVSRIQSYYSFPAQQEVKDETFDFLYSGDALHTVSYKREWSGIFEGLINLEYTNNKLTKAINNRWDPIDSVYFEYSVDDIIWIGNNVSRTVLTALNQSTRTVDYVYDDMKTPLRHEGLGIITYGSYATLSENNVTKGTTTYEDGSTYVTNLELTYNASGYPSSITLLDPDFTAYPTNYEYKCN